MYNYILLRGGHVLAIVGRLFTFPSRLLRKEGAKLPRPISSEVGGNVGGEGGGFSGLPLKPRPLRLHDCQKETNRQALSKDSAFRCRREEATERRITLRLMDVKVDSTNLFCHRAPVQGRG